MSVQKTDLNLFRRLRPAEVCDAGLVRWAGGRLRRFVQSQSAEVCDAGPAFWEGEITMSFAGDVKTELCRGKLGDKSAAQAEACGVLLYCNRFTLDQVKIVTESPAFAKRLPGLFRKAFGLTFDEKGDPGTPGKRIFTIGDRAKLALLWEVCAFDPSDPAHHINFGLLEDGPCRVAFLRGAFLAGGSVTDPQKGYHLELATTHLRVSRELHTLLLELGYTPKETTRKANYITYFSRNRAWKALARAPVRRLLPTGSSGFTGVIIPRVIMAPVMAPHSSPVWAPAPKPPPRSKLACSVRPVRSV